MDASAPVPLISANGPVLRTSVAIAPEKFLRKTFAAGSGSAVGAFVGLTINVFHGQRPSGVLKEIAAASGMFHSGSVGGGLRKGGWIAEPWAALPDTAGF
jgi:hypothetical protein